MWHSIEKGPYVRPMIPDLDCTTKQIIEPLSKMTGINKKQYIADVRVMNYLLQAIPNDVYNSVDTSKEGESLEYVYERLTKLVNIMDHNNVHPIPVLINTKFLNCLQPEWSKYVTLDGRVDIQTKNARYDGNGYYAHDCQKPRVHDAKYFREQMLLAMKDEAGSNLKDEENDFMLDNSYGDETLEELTVAAISEVNALYKMIPTVVHEHKNHGKCKTVVNTYDDDQINSNIIFDDPYVENNGRSAEHDSNAHDPYHDIKMLAYNLAKEAFKERENRYLEDIVDLEEKLSSHDRIVYKIGQSVQTIHMLGKTPNKVYDPFLKAGLGYQNPKLLKKAIAAQPNVFSTEDPGLDWISAHNFLTRLEKLSSYASGHLEVSELAACLEKLHFSGLLVMSKFSRICFSFVILKVLLSEYFGFDMSSALNFLCRDENPIRTLGDYSKPSHEGYRNTIELPEGNDVVPLRSDTIRLVQNGCSFHGLRFEDPNQHLKDFLKLVDSLNLDGDNRERTRLRLFQFSLRDQASNWLERLPVGSITTWEDLTTRFLAQFFPPGRTAKLRNDILMFQQHHGESLSEA
ncbi:zinc finger, CCHC-type containing protein [Tanacetum coccineum]